VTTTVEVTSTEDEVLDTAILGAFVTVDAFTTTDVDFTDTVFAAALEVVTRRRVEAVTVAWCLGELCVVFAVVELDPAWMGIVEFDTATIGAAALAAATMADVELAVAIMAGVDFDNANAGGAPPVRSARNACAACGLLARKLSRLARLGPVLVPLIAREPDGRVAFVSGAEGGLADWAACAPGFFAVVVVPFAMD